MSESLDTRVDESVESTLDSIPWADVPINTTLPEQLYDWQIIDVFGARWPDSADGLEGKAYVAVVMTALAPQDFLGRQHTENFTVGTESDPRASRIETWLNGQAFGATNLKRLIDFHQVANWRELKNKTFSGFIRNNPSKDKTREYSNLVSTQFYHVGEVLAGTPLPSNNRRRLQATPNNNNYTVNADKSVVPTEVPCPMCGKLILAADVIDHVKACNG